MPTITIHMPEQTGQTGLTLFIRKTSDGNLLNAGGDALTESPAASGRFVATVAETIAQVSHCTIRNAASLAVRDGWLSAGGTIVVDGYPLDAVTAAIACRGSLSIGQVIDLIAAAVAGRSSTPTEATELFKFLDGADAFVTQFDESNNRVTVTLQ